MDTALRAAQLAHRWMIETVERNAPSADTINEVMIGRSLVAGNAIKAVELAIGTGGRCRFLPQQRAGTLLPRHPGRPLPSVAGRPAGALCGRDGARLAGDAYLLNCLPEFRVSPARRPPDNMAASFPAHPPANFEKSKLSYLTDRSHAENARMIFSRGWPCLRTT